MRTAHNLIAGSDGPYVTVSYGLLCVFHTDLA